MAFDKSAAAKKQKRGPGGQFAAGGAGKQRKKPTAKKPATKTAAGGAGRKRKKA